MALGSTDSRRSHLHLVVSGEQPLEAPRNALDDDLDLGADFDDTDKAVEPGDPVVAAFDPEAHLAPVERLRAIELALARAAAELRWVRDHEDDYADPLEEGRAISRRVRALRRLAETELAVVREYGAHAEDVVSPQLTTVLGLLFGRVVEVMHETVPDRADVLAARLRAAAAADPQIPWP